MKGGRWLAYDDEGSLTVEAALIVPVICLLMVVFLKLGFFLKDTIQDSADGRDRPRLQDTQGLTPIDTDESSRLGFLAGSMPARRIRDTDLLIEAGYALKEKIPTWFGKEDQDGL